MAGYQWTDLSLDAQNKATQIYQWLLSFYNNDAGVSAIMGNMWVESAGTFDGRICEGYQESDLDGFCETYTEEVDDGTISRSQFETANWGYGLMQWTWSSRRVGLYDYCFNNGYTTIGYNLMQVEYIDYELTSGSYDIAYNAVINADPNDIDTATYLFMDNYLSPGDPHLPAREEAARSIYNALSGLPPIPPIPPGRLIDILVLKHFIDANHKRRYIY